MVSKRAYHAEAVHSGQAFVMNSRKTDRDAPLPNREFLVCMSTRAWGPWASLCDALRVHLQTKKDLRLFALVLALVKLLLASELIGCEWRNPSVTDSVSSHRMRRT